MSMPHTCRCVTCGAEGVIVPNSFLVRTGGSGEIVNPHVLPAAVEPEQPCTLTRGCWLAAGHDGHCD